MEFKDTSIKILAFKKYIKSLIVLSRNDEEFRIAFIYFLQGLKNIDPIHIALGMVLPVLTCFKIAIINQEKELDYLSRLYINTLKLLNSELANQLFDFYSKSRNILLDREKINLMEISIKLLEEETEKIANSIAILIKEYGRRKVAFQ